MPTERRCRHCGTQLHISDDNQLNAETCDVCGRENAPAGSTHVDLGTSADPFGGHLPTSGKRSSTSAPQHAAGEPPLELPPLPKPPVDDPFMRPPWYDERADKRPASNPYAPPIEAGYARSSDIWELQLATRGQRFAGRLIDRLLVPLVWLAFCGIVGAAMMPFGVDQNEWLQAALGMIYFGGFLIVPCVNWYLIVKDGQTIGKKMAGTRIVVETTGKIPTFFVGVVIRNWIPNMLTAVPLLGAVFALVNALFIFGDKRQCIHDLLASTRVVKADQD